MGAFCVEYTQDSRKSISQSRNKAYKSCSFILPQLFSKALQYYDYSLQMFTVPAFEYLQLDNILSLQMCFCALNCFQVHKV